MVIGVAVDVAVFSIHSLITDISHLGSQCARMRDVRVYIFRRDETGIWKVKTGIKERGNCPMGSPKAPSLLELGN